MGIVVATCGHELLEAEGIGEPFWLYDGGELSWLVYCASCKAKLTPVYFFNLEVLMKEATQEAVGC